MLLVLLAMLAACGGGGGGAAPAPTPVVLSISGTVRSAADGQALSGVEVSAGGRSTRSAGDGSFTLTDVVWGDQVAVRFDLAGHARGVVTVVAPQDAQARAHAQLVPVTHSQTLDPAGAATVSDGNSPAQVSLPANALVNAATGAAASGTVTAELTVIDPARNPASMPGNFTAAPASGSGAVRSIESFGAINVSLKDSAGSALNLASGQRATIRIPVSTRSADIPATIPLFFFNETTGLWVEEGSATLAGAAPNQYYEGTVSHFSYWNADRQAETIFVHGCVRDAANTPVQGVPVRTEGVDYSGSASSLSNAQGNFSVAMRRGGVAHVLAELGDRTSNVVQAGPSQTDITLPACLVLGGSPQPPVIVVPPQDQAALPGGYAVFTVQAVGTGVLRYQWLRNDVPVPGATSTNLVLTGLSATDDGARFHVVVSNDVGSTTSTPATLQIDTTPQPPLLLQQPQPASVAVGGRATFQVQAQSRGGQLSFQWLRNGNPIAGATGTSYTTPAALAGDDGSLFSVRVTSDNGASVLSDSARLTVVAVVTPPGIEQQPAAASVGVGQQASFSVTASGSPTLLYQWRRNGVDIAGATGPSHTTAATTTADNGAVFTVVVSNGGGSVTSNGATLTVTQPTGQGGYYLVSTAGPTVQGTMTFADGVQNIVSQALLAVSASNPAATPVTLAPAGQMGQLALPVVQATISGNQVSAARSRFTVFFNNGRLYKVDQVVAGSGTPAAQLLSALSTTQICFGTTSGILGFNLEGDDLADPTRSWVFLPGPGTDGVCGNTDDAVLAVRLDMDGSAAAVVVPGEPQAAIRSANGGITGFIVRQGVQLRRTDASFGNPSNLFTLGSGFETGPVALASGLPGVWFYREGNSLRALNLANPTAPQTVTTLLAGETLPFEAVGGGGALYLALGSSAATRVLRVDNALGGTVVATLPGGGDRFVSELFAADTHLVAWLGDTVQSVPLAGGATVTLFSAAQGQSVSRVAVGASGVAVQVSALLPPSPLTSSLLLVNADGSNPQTLDNTELVAEVGAATETLEHVLSRNYALVLARGGVSSVDQAGATLSALALDSRQTLMTYGALPATPSGQLFGSLAMPLQWGQPGLLSFFSFSTTPPFTSASDLYFLDSDSAGLVRVSSFIAGRGTANPTSATVRPQARRGGLPGAGLWR